MNIDKVMALMPTIGHETQAKIRTALEQLVVSAREGAFCEAADAIGGLYSTKPQGLAERVEALAERVEALERANGGYVLAKPEDVDARVAQAARAGLAEMMSALRVLVREEIAASAKNTGEGEVEHAASVSRSVSAKDASRATTPNNAEEGASAMRHGSGARPDATSLSTACPLCHGMLSEDECKKQNTPSPQGSTASAERSVRVDVVHANDGTPLMAAAHVAQPLTGGEGVLSWVPSAEELIQCARAANEVPRDPSEPISKNLLAQAEATRRLIASRAPRPVSVEEMAERLLNAQLKHYGLSPRAWAQVGEEERAYWLALARAAIGGGG